jgi:hypothetical protein
MSYGYGGYGYGGYSSQNPYSSINLSNILGGHKKPASTASKTVYSPYSSYASSNNTKASSSGGSPYSGGSKNPYTTSSSSSYKPAASTSSSYTPAASNMSTYASAYKSNPYLSIPAAAKIAEVKLTHTDYKRPSEGLCKALLVGVNYKGTRAALAGCINDVENAQDYLKEYGFDSIDDINTRILTEDQEEDERQPTRANILKGLVWLVEDAKAGDVFWFHYSGHGSQMRDQSGDEKDGMDESVQPVDYFRNGSIVDDEFRAHMVDVLPAGVTLYAIFDCCHSGTLLELSHVYNEQENSFASDSTVEDTTASVYMISGCMNVQTSADLPVGFQEGLTESVGALSSAMYPMIDEGCSWHNLIKSVRHNLKTSRLKQVPQFETGRVIDLSEVAFGAAFPSMAKADDTDSASDTDSDDSDYEEVKNVKYEALKSKADFMANVLKDATVAAALAKFLAILKADSIFRYEYYTYQFMFNGVGVADGVETFIETFYEQLASDATTFVSSPDLTAQVRVLREALNAMEAVKLLLAAHPEWSEKTDDAALDGALAAAVAAKGGITKACMIGINYEGTSAALSGCINDVENMTDKLKSLGFSAEKEENMMYLTEEEKEDRHPTKQNILDAMEWLVADAKAGDVLWFHFSGHGSQQRDYTGEEKDGTDENIVPLDYNRRGCIQDDDLNNILVDKVPEGATLYAVFDCCHSGTMLDMHFVYDEPNVAFVSDSSNPKSKGTTYMISGCMNVQTSADLPPGFEEGLDESVGALSGALLRYMGRDMTWGDMIKGVRSDLKAARLRQIPQFEVSNDVDPRESAFCKAFPVQMKGSPAARDVPLYCVPPADRSVVVAQRHMFKAFRENLAQVDDQLRMAFSKFTRSLARGNMRPLVRRIRAEIQAGGVVPSINDVATRYYEVMGKRVEKKKQHFIKKLGRNDSYPLACFHVVLSLSLAKEGNEEGNAILADLASRFKAFDALLSSVDKPSDLGSDSDDEVNERKERKANWGKRQARMEERKDGREQRQKEREERKAARKDERKAKKQQLKAKKQARREKKRERKKSNKKSGKKKKKTRK